MAQELHIAKKTVSRINGITRTAETITSAAELELHKAKEIVRELTFQIEELKSKANGQTSQKPVQSRNQRYTEVIRELEDLKREVSNIKLDMECSLEEKIRAENEANAESLRLRSYVNTAEKLRKDIEDANEEEILVELARYQALKELAAIDARRKEEAGNSESKFRETGKRINFLRKEAEKAKIFEEVLAITQAEADVLQNELKFINDMDESHATMIDSENLSVMEDLKAAGKEQASIKAEVFQLMTSIDLTRTELNNVLKVKSKLEKEEAKTEKYVKKLNSKLLRLKDKSEIANASEEKAKSMLPSFVLSLQEFEKVKEEAKKERKSNIEEIAVTRDIIQITELSTDLTEEILHDAMQEMEAVQKAEANALNKLKAVVESTVVNRASKNYNDITISKFEYDYLTGCAMGAKELAEKKVAAALAWADALRANAKEIEITSEMTMKESKELRLKEEQELNKIEILVNARNNTVKMENSYKPAPIRQAKLRKSVASPAVRRPIILTLKRQRKVMHKLPNYFAKQDENEKTVSLEESK